jgi:hypothetical protein
MQNTNPKFLERWANVHSLVSSIPDDQRFSMSNWGREDKESACGTAACAAGHAALHPWFRKRGLKTRFELSYPSYMFGFMEIPNRDVFFGLTDWYDSPFCPEWCVHNPYKLGHLTPKRVATSIKEYMLIYWPRGAVNEALKKAVATYDAAHVHKNVPWDCPAEQ